MVPAVSRCRARQHHGQAVNDVPERRKPRKCHSAATGAPRADSEIL